MTLDWVYLYKDRTDGKYKYIGRAKSAERLCERLYDHLYDKWCAEGNWEIKVFPCINRAESEAVETELINIHDPQFNKGKRGWGILGINIPPENEWVNFPDITLLRDCKTAVKGSCRRAELETIKMLPAEMKKRRNYETA